MFARLSIKSLALSLCLMHSIESTLASPVVKVEMTAGTSAIDGVLADSQAFSGRGDSCTACGTDLASCVSGSGGGNFPNTTSTIDVKAVLADILKYHLPPNAKPSSTGVVMVVVSFMLGYAALKLVNFVQTSRASARRKRSAPFEGFKHFVPNPHWYLGHINLMAKENYVANSRKLFVDHANPSNGVSTFWFVSVPTVSVLRSKDVQKVLNTSFHRDNPASVEHHFQAFAGKKSLIATTNYSEWMANRTVVHRAFIPAALHEIHASMCTVAQRGVDTILRQIREQQPYDEGVKGGGTFEKEVFMTMLPVFKMFSMDSVGISTLGHDFGCTTNFRTNSVVEAFDFLAKDFSRRVFDEPWNPAAQHYWIPTPFNIRHWHANAKLRKYLRVLIQQRRREATNSAPSKKDLLGRLLIASTDSVELSDEYLSDFFVTIMFAGLDTTAILLSYACYILATNPEYEEKCVEEVKRVLGPAPNMPESFHWSQLPYCQAILLETLRLYPPAPQTARTLDKPLEVDGFSFPSGTKVLLNMWWIHRYPGNFPRPLEFLPERWVQMTDGASEPNESMWEERSPRHDKGQASAAPNQIPAADKKGFFAFSGGGRSCVGQRFAMQNATITFALFIRELKLRAIPGYVLETEKHGLSLQPSQDIPMLLSRR